MGNIEQLKLLTKEFSKAEDIYKLITIKSMTDNIDIKHKYYMYNVPEEYINSVQILTYNNIIAEIARENSYINIVMDNKNCNQYLYAILGCLYDRLIDLIHNKELEYCISVLSMLEINRYYAKGITLWSRKQEFETNNDNLFDAIIKVLNADGYEEGAENYLYFDNLFAKDKNALETIFPQIYKKIDLDNAIQNKLKISDLNIGLLLNLAIAILYIFNIIDEFKRGDLKNEKIEVDSNGNFLFCCKNSTDKKIEYYNYILKSGDSYVSRYIDKMNNVMEKILGFSEANINVIIDSLNDFLGLCGNEYIVEEKEKLIKLLASKSKMNIKNINKMINYLIYQLPQTPYDGKTHFEDKITRRSILNINGILLVPLGLLKTGIINIYMDVTNNQISDPILKKSLNEVYALMNSEFEEIVFDKCKRDIQYKFIQKNVQQKDIKIGEVCIELPGEIDVLLLYEDVLFVFECKNIATRTTYDMINSLRIDLISDYKNTSFQKKLKFKIDRLKDNIEVVEKFVGTQNTIRDVTGCIVTKGFYFKPIVAKNSVYDVISWSELTDWVNRYIAKEDMK